MNNHQIPQNLIHQNHNLKIHEIRIELKINHYKERKEYQHHHQNQNHHEEELPVHLKRIRIRIKIKIEIKEYLYHNHSHKDDVEHILNHSLNPNHNHDHNVMRKRMKRWKIGKLWNTMNAWCRCIVKWLYQYFYIVVFFLYSVLAKNKKKNDWFCIYDLCPLMILRMVNNISFMVWN